MIVKQCQFRGKDEHGVHIHLLHPGYTNEHLTKVAAASPPQLDHVFEIVRGMPKNGNSLPVLVSAMGAGEYWGSNSNGDYFPEESLIHVPQNWNGMSLDLQKQMGAKWEWGYPTFYNAFAYQHHSNKDPARAFGTVEYALWDSSMKRVLLVVNIDRQKARQMGAIGVVDKIENGEFPDVSMGCRVPYDVCTICTDWSRVTKNPRIDLAEHKKQPIRGLSTTRSEYCQHLQAELNKIYPDGRKVAMINLHPKFFDISFVFIGADKTSKVMAKLAGQQLCPIRTNSPMCKSGCFDCAIPSSHVHEVWSRDGSMSKTAEGKGRSGVAVPTTNSVGKMKKQSTTFPGFERELEDEEKLAFAFGLDKRSAAEIAKKAEIIKQVRSNFSKNLPGMIEEEPPIPNGILDQMAKCPPEALSTAGSMGIILKPQEFQRTIIVHRGRPDLADELSDAGVCFRPGAGPSRDFSLPSMIIPRLLEALAPLMNGRSCFGPPIHRRIIQLTIVKKPQAPQEFADDLLLSKLSADYSAYRQQLLYKQAALTNQLLHEHPWVTPHILEPLVVGSPTGGIVKVGGSVMESIIGMLSIDYLNQAHMPEPISKYVLDNCDLDGLKSAGELASCGRVA